MSHLRVSLDSLRARVNRDLRDDRKHQWGPQDNTRPVLRPWLLSDSAHYPRWLAVSPAGAATTNDGQAAGGRPTVSSTMTLKMFKALDSMLSGSVRDKVAKRFHDLSFVQADLRRLSVAIEDALRRLIADRAWAERLGIEARRTIEARFSLDGVARQYLDAYHDLLDGRQCVG